MYGTDLNDARSRFILMLFVTFIPLIRRVATR